jgi:diacylglycerol kinase family enzyme
VGVIAFNVGQTFLSASGGRHECLPHESQAGMRVCVIFNPAAGRRRSRRRLAKFRERWEGSAEFWPMEFRGHGTQLARAASDQGFTVIAAAGGDGTVHEVANGLLTAAAVGATLAVVPIGSANDYAYSFAQQFDNSVLDDDNGVMVDVGAVTTPQGRERHFVESIGLAFSAQVTLESQRISWLQRKSLYALAVFRALRNVRPVELVIRYDDESPIRNHVLLQSAMLGRREGGFVLASKAELSDGMFDVIAAAPLSRWRILAMLPRIALAGAPANHPQISQRRCRTIHVQSAMPFIVHTDGEMFATATEDVHELSIRLLPSRLRVKLCPP